MKIDVHAHFVPESCIDIQSTVRESGAEAVRVTQPDTGQVVYSGQTADRNFEAEQMHNVDRRLRDMHERQVDMHVLSAPTTLLGYRLDPAKALALDRRINDAFAETVASNPAHFVGLAAVPLQAPEESARELERAVRELGLRGVQIGTNVNGTNLDDPSLTPFYAKVQELDVPVFIHPLTVLGAERLRGYHLGNLIGNPTEDAVAAASLIFGGVLKEFPRLKFYIAHGGGSCPFLRGRWEHGWRVRPEARVKIDRPPSEYFRLLYFDSLTHSGPALNYLVETVGPERVMLGTDYPYDMSDADPLKTIASLPHLSDRQRDMIYGLNAAALFRIEV